MSFKADANSVKNSIFILWPYKESKVKFSKVFSGHHIVNRLYKFQVINSRQSGNTVLFRIFHMNYSARFQPIQQYSFQSCSTQCLTPLLVSQLAVAARVSCLGPTLPCMSSVPPPPHPRPSQCSIFDAEPH